jgi:hypothetical protein
MYEQTNMKYVVIACMLLCAFLCNAEEIVVLAETPVAEFALPDGSVLHNAYVWRRSSQGLMIMHDGGSYFLNFTLLPDDWKAAYLGAPAEGETGVEAEPELEEMHDKYEVATLIEQIPDLNAVARSVLLGKDISVDLDKGVLTLGLLQSLLVNERDAAKRFFILIEEKEYEIDGIALEQLFNSCVNCAGDGQLDKNCTMCSGSGQCLKCDGQGVRNSGITSSKNAEKSKKSRKNKKTSDSSKSGMHCTTCRGTGTCLSCKGEGMLTPSCPECRGAGKLVAQDYCEIMRDKLVREINASSTNGKMAAVTSSSSTDFGKVLAELPKLTPEAQSFYLSNAYAGEMDTNILVACVIHSLLSDHLEEAKRFDLMSHIEFSSDEVLDVEKYLKPCGKCETTGRIERDCRSCDGSGKCDRCEGSGKRKQEIGDDRIHCTTCRGSGKCGSCSGVGKLKPQCRACKGRGRILERQRTEIKLGLLVDELNAFHNER